MSLHLSFLSPASISSLRSIIPPLRLRSVAAVGVARLRGIKAQQNGKELPPGRTTRWEKVLATAASLYPLYVTAGGAVACVEPSAFSWFVERGPGSYSLTLGFIMLAMGLTLDLEDFFSLIVKRPLSVSFFYFFIFCFGNIGKCLDHFVIHWCRYFLGVPLNTR